MGTNELEIIPQQAAQHVALTRAGNIIDPAVINNLFRLAKVWHESRLLPKHIDTPQKAITIAMMGDALGVNWLVALQGMYVVGGRAGMEAKLGRALVQSSPVCEYFYFEETTPTRATLVHKRRNNPREQRETLTLEQCQQANFHQAWNREKSVWEVKPMWKQIPDVMIAERLTMRVIRREYSDLIHGMGAYSFDELNLPTRIGSAGEVEIDSEAVAAAPTVEVQAEPVPSTASMEPPKVGDIATDAQRATLKELAKRLYPDGSPVVLPSERRKITDAVVADSSATGFAAQIEFWEAEVARRLEAREAEQAAREVAGS